MALHDACFACNTELDIAHDGGTLCDNCGYSFCGNCMSLDGSADSLCGSCWDDLDHVDNDIEE